MGFLIKTVTILFVSLCLSACGVKGRPQPPLNPAPLGRGEPMYKEAAPVKIKKKKNLTPEEEKVLPEER